jgi:DNA invertase Pin-like site-specific DNA recombinase
MMTAKPMSVYTSKLTADVARLVKRRLADGKAVKDIAIEFDVSQTGVYHIKNGRTWRDVQ